jgi:hypothetical protein
MSINRALIVLAVVAIHVLLLGVLWQAMHQPLRNRPSSQVARSDRSQTIVFLLEPYESAAIKPRRDEARPDARRTHADRVQNAAVPMQVYGSEVSNAAALTSAPTPGDTSAEVPKQLGSALNLSLSRETLKTLVPGLAARSPFQGRLPVTVERKIAEAAAETGPWTEERIDADHILLRRGTTCVMVSRPQIAKIDPFSDSIGRLPWGVSQPSECR